jgi:CRP-like cAMP-binding protein
MDNIRYSPPPSVNKIRPGLPEGLDLVIQRALEKEPDQRYPTGEEFAEEIQRAMQGKRIPVRDLKAAKKADLLKSVDFFRAFSRSEIEEVAKFGTFIRYHKSQVIVREGDVDTTFFVLLYGKVRVVQNNRRIVDLPAGACFGEMGAVTRTPRTAHVIAREACIVLKLDLKILERESPALRMKFYEIFMRTLIERLEKTTRRLSSDRKRDAKARLSEQAERADLTEQPQKDAEAVEGEPTEPSGKLAPGELTERSADIIDEEVPTDVTEGEPLHLDVPEDAGEQTEPATVDDYEPTERLEDVMEFVRPKT